jgi:hypothetical protein
LRTLLGDFNICPPHSHPPTTLSEVMIMNPHLTFLSWVLWGSHEVMGTQKVLVNCQELAGCVGCEELLLGADS